jgi:uncharacterized protein YdiU (UPF0061 family)
MAARKRNPVPALNEIRAEKVIENAMLGNNASSWHLLGAVWETRFTGKKDSPPFALLRKSHGSPLSKCFTGLT